VTNKMRDQVFLEALPLMLGVFCLLWGLHRIYDPAWQIFAGIGLIWFSRQSR